ncbi:outer membrane protein, YaiO family [Thiohalospira halophila DSM 15071]|uniref:Outer membrane protein, YaiO family n=1 Tax=Thiohalospira halophila DSM 15071 TaxID=1123397 RepID=A0A1I1VU61_9GAMM|nr:tetratricopeptide repeat protein [Thiohalospira halophila]SFD86567.1 outer membrane protein, YaiO family [Thiohalospira halophila DSM 15071]
MRIRALRWPITVGAFALVATLATPASSATSGESASLREQAESSWAAGNWAAAEEQLGKLHRQQPGNAEILRRWGLAAAYQDDYERALQRLRQARTLEPENTDILLDLARVHAWREDYPESEKRITAVLERNPDLAAAHSLRGQLAFYRGDLTAAAGHYRDALERTPDSEQARSGLERIRQARDAHTRWRFDLTHARSRVRIGDAELDWQETNLAAARTFGGPAAKRPWTLTGHVHRAVRVGDSATQLGLGGILPLLPNATLRAEAGVGRGAEFLPRSYWLVGGNWRLRQGGTLLGPTALDTTVSRRTYADGTTDLLGPAVEQSFFIADHGARLRTTLRLLEIRDSQGEWRTGYSLRLDSRLNRDWEVYGGYSVAYETDGDLVGEEAPEVRTAFGGLAWQFADNQRLSCTRTRQDRDHVAGWRRQEWRCSLTLRH